MAAQFHSTTDSHGAVAFLCVREHLDYEQYSFICEPVEPWHLAWWHRRLNQRLYALLTLLGIIHGLPVLEQRERH